MHAGYACMILKSRHNANLDGGNIQQAKLNEFGARVPLLEGSCSGLCWACLHAGENLTQSMPRSREQLISLGDNNDGPLTASDWGRLATIRQIPRLCERFLCCLGWRVSTVSMSPFCSYFIVLTPWPPGSLTKLPNCLVIRIQRFPREPQAFSFLHMYPRTALFVVV